MGSMGGERLMPIERSYKDVAGRGASATLDQAEAPLDLMTVLAMTLSPNELSAAEHGDPIAAHAA
jgi:hypothetical protein